MVCLETTAAQVNDLDLTAAVALHKDVLGFQVAVYEAKTVDVGQGFQALLRDRLQISPL